MSKYYGTEEWTVEDGYFASKNMRMTNFDELKRSGREGRA
jgi:hypothetical protein